VFPCDVISARPASLGGGRGQFWTRVQYRGFFNVSPLAQATVHVTQPIWRGTIDSVTLADIRPDKRRRPARVAFCDEGPPGKEVPRLDPSNLPQ